MTPIIWISTDSRIPQSSVSYAEENQVKVSQAHTIANIAIRKATNPLRKWPDTVACANAAPARLNDTTIVRSYSSSSVLATRCSSRVSRPRIGTRPWGRSLTTAA